MATIFVKPRHGVILAGIPAKGADVEKSLAEEWLDNGLVVQADDPKSKSKPKPRPAPKPGEVERGPVVTTPQKEG